MGFVFKHITTGIQVWYGGSLVGGRETKNGHLYIVKSFGEREGRPAILERYGFERIPKGSYLWWRLDDNKPLRFASAVEEIVGESVPLQMLGY